MEVHSHTHTPRKKWTHYFWEFLMLFLAVTLGFFVENQREHFIEHKREKEYIRSLITDLARDTVHANIHLRGNIQKFHGLDSLAELLFNEAPIDSAKTSRLYELSFRYARNTSFVVTNEITIQQLLSSGNVRLLRTKGVYDSLVLYQLKKALVSNTVAAYDEIFKNIMSYNENIFSVREYRKIIMNSDTSFSRISNVRYMPLLTTDRSKLIKYAESIELYRAVISTYTQNLRNVKRSAINLLVFLKKEYHLD